MNSKEFDQHKDTVQTLKSNRFTVIKLRCPRKTNIPLRQKVLFPLEYYIKLGDILNSTGRAGGSQERSFVFSRKKKSVLALR